MGKKLTLSIWENASQDPVPRKPTTFPFGKDLFVRDLDPSRSSASGESSIEEKEGNPFADPDSKGKGDVKVKEEEV